MSTPCPAAAQDLEIRPSLDFYALVVEGDAAVFEHLWVEPAAMGRGVGRALVEHAVEMAWGLGVTRIEIESDPHAEPFYHRMGAKRTGAVPAPVPGDPTRCLPLLTIRRPEHR